MKLNEACKIAGLKGTGELVSYTGMAPSTIARIYVHDPKKVYALLSGAAINKFMHNLTMVKRELELMEKKL